MNAALIGQNLLGKKDKGTRERSSSGETKPRKKTSFIYRVPGKNLLAGAGIYEQFDPNGR